MAYWDGNEDELDLLGDDGLEEEAEKKEDAETEDEEEDEEEAEEGLE